MLLHKRKKNDSETLCLWARNQMQLSSVIQAQISHETAVTMLMRPAVIS